MRFLLPGLLVSLIACARAPEAQRLPKIQIEVGGRKLAVEVALTPQQREIGLMHRRRIGQDEGMLFVFPSDQNLAFYMRNTHIPLSVAFIQSDGVIANIAHMEPMTLTPHHSRLACRYALEMPQGWFERNGVREGSRVVLPRGLLAE